jgi:anti-sigma factor RsiW
VTSTRNLPHDRAFELLPWLVNGRLAAAQRETVDAHVRTCMVCRRELKEQQRLQAAVLAQPTTHVSAQAGFDRLDRQLDDTVHEQRRTWRARYATLRPFAIAAAAGIAMLAVLLWVTPLPQIGAGTYSTLATAPSDDTVLLDVVFAQQTSAAEMQKLLDDIDGEIVAGPGGSGRYSVRVGDGHLDPERLTELLRVLAADPRVRFAARSLIEPSR